MSGDPAPGDLPGDLSGDDARDHAADSAVIVPRSLRLASEWAWRIIVIAVAVGAVVWAASYLSLVIVPVIVAVFGAALLEPIRGRLMKMGLSATWSASLSLLIGFVVVVSFVGLAVGQVVANFDDLTDQATDGVGKVADWLETGPLKIRAGGLEDAMDNAVDDLRENPSEVFSGTVSVLATTGGLLTGGILALIVTVFVVFDRTRIWSGVCAAAPPGQCDRIDRAGRSAWSILVGYVRVTLLEAVFDSLAIGTAVAIAGVPVAFALGAIVFLSVFIPIIGAILSGLLVVLVALVTKGFTTAVILLVVVLVVQQFDANVIYPVLTSRRLSMHPLVSLLLVTSGALVGGLFGAFVAVPFAGMALAARRTYQGGDELVLDDEYLPVDIDVENGDVGNGDVGNGDVGDGPVGDGTTLPP